MSGLEPLAALGLACGVFQIISFAGEVCRATKAIFQNGEAPESMRALDTTLESLTGVYSQINATATPTQQRALTGNDLELLRIAKECHAAAMALKAQVDKSIMATSTQARAHLLKSVLAGFKTTSRSTTKEIEKLEKMLQRHQNALETRLLFNVSSKTDAVHVRQDSRFDHLDTTLQRFIQAFANGETRMSQLLSKEVVSIKEHVSKETTDLKATLVNEATLRRLLQSLKYGSMNERRNQISAPSAKTFGWIFSGSDVDHADYDSEHPQTTEFAVYQRSRVLGQLSARNDASALFRLWLQPPNQPSLFWISGKPGSGKSTLMKYLAKAPQTIEILRGNHMSGAIVLSHFIWSAGQFIERSIKGILCSLFRQLLEQEPGNLARLIIARYPDTQVKDSVSDWDDAELEEAFVFSLQQCTSKICIFLDGLDEIGTGLLDGQARLLALLARLRLQVPMLKLCVASRPESMLENALSKFLMIRIHELTQFDIWRFTSNTFRERFPSYIGRSGDEGHTSGLIDSICWRSEGVFLWVALALRTLEHGLENGDSMGELEERLDALPEDLELLYKAMWERLGVNKEIYRRDAAVYLNTALNYPIASPLASWPLPLVQAVLAVDWTSIDEVVCGKADASTVAQKMLDQSSEYARRIEIRTVGFLEVQLDEENLLKSNVKFIHRSAKDFVERTEAGQRLLEFDPVPLGDRIARSMRVMIAFSFLFCTHWVYPELHHSIPKADRCINRCLVLGSGKKIAPEKVLGLCRVVERLYSAQSPSSKSGLRLLSWTIPRTSFLVMAATFGLTDIVQEGLRNYRCSGALSPLFKSRLVSAALGGAEMLTTFRPNSDNLCEEARKKMELAELLFEEGNNDIDVNYGYMSTGDLIYSRLWENSTFALSPITPVESAIELLIKNRDRSTLLCISPARLLNKMLSRGLSTTKLTTFVLTNPRADGIDSIGFLRVGACGYFAHHRRSRLGFQGTDIIIDTTIRVLLDILVAHFPSAIKSHVSINELINHAQRHPGPRVIHKIYCIRRQFSGLDSVLTESEYCVVDDQAILSRFQKSMNSVRRGSDAKNMNMLGVSKIVEDVWNQTSRCKVHDIIEDLIDRDRVWLWDDPRALPPRPHGENCDHS